MRLRFCVSSTPLLLSPPPGESKPGGGGEWTTSTTTDGLRRPGRALRMPGGELALRCCSGDSGFRRMEGAGRASWVACGNFGTLGGEVEETAREPPGDTGGEYTSPSERDRPMEAP